MKLSEKAFQKHFEDRGYDVIFNGKPDFIILGEGMILFRELKTENSCVISDSQQRAIDLLRNHGFDAEVIVMKEVNPKLTDKGEISYDAEFIKLYPFKGAFTIE